MSNRSCMIISPCFYGPPSGDFPIDWPSRSPAIFSKSSGIRSYQHLAVSSSGPFSGSISPGKKAVHLFFIIIRVCCFSLFFSPYSQTWELSTAPRATAREEHLRGGQSLRIRPPLFRTHKDGSLAEIKSGDGSRTSCFGVDSLRSLSKILPPPDIHGTFHPPRKGSPLDTDSPYLFTKYAIA